MINRKQCKCLLISSLSGSTRNTSEWRDAASLAIPTVFLVLPDKLDIKRHYHGILYILDIPFGYYENSADPDQTPRSAASEQGLHGLLCYEPSAATSSKIITKCINKQRKIEYNLDSSHKTLKVASEL